MTAYRGEIWLANLNPSRKNNEIGKIRPVVVLQNDNLAVNGYPTTIIMPLTTHLIDDASPIRTRITRRDGLEQDSDIVITQIRAIDNSRFIERIANISEDEMDEIQSCLQEIIAK